MSITVENLPERSASFDRLQQPLVFRVCGSSQDGREIRLKASRITVGSAEGCTLRIRARGVHPVHCLVIRGQCRTIVRRTHPATLLNEGGFSDAELREGDRLQVGPVVLEYRPELSTVGSDGNPSAEPARSGNSTPIEPIDGKEDASAGDRRPLADLSRREAELRSRETGLARREKELEQAAESLQRREEALAAKQDALTKKEESLATREEALARNEDALIRKEEALAKKEEALARRGETLTRMEQALATKEETLTRKEEALATKEQELRESENRLTRREKDRQKSEENNRQDGQDLEACRNSLDEREGVVAARERELHEWESRIAERESRLQRDEEELRRRISQIAARERELSDREAARQPQEPTGDVTSTLPAGSPQAVPVETLAGLSPDSSDPFAPPKTPGMEWRESEPEQDPDAGRAELTETAGDRQCAASRETTLISAKWLRWQDDAEEPAAAPGSQPGEDRTAVLSPPQSPLDQTTHDEGEGEVHTYMQELMSRLNGRDAPPQSNPTVCDDRGQDTDSTAKGGQGGESPLARKPRASKAAARPRPQAAEKSVDFAAMRELAVLASQGAIDRYAKAKLRRAMTGKLAVMITALGSVLVLIVLACVGRFPDVGTYGIVAAVVTLLVYALQYALLSGRLIVNQRGQLQLAQRRISREMLKLQTGEKSSPQPPQTAETGTPGEENDPCGEPAPSDVHEPSPG